MSHEDFPQPSGSTNEPEKDLSPSEIPEKSHFEKDPIQQLEDKIVEEISHGKWADRDVVNLLIKWREEIIQEMYSGKEKVADEYVNKMYEKEMVRFVKQISDSLPTEEEKEKFLNFLDGEDIL